MPLLLPFTPERLAEVVAVNYRGRHRIPGAVLVTGHGTEAPGETPTGYAGRHRTPLGAARTMGAAYRTRAAWRAERHAGRSGRP